MPTTPETATLLDARRRVTGVVAIYDAGTLQPCRAGDKVALHILTTEGEIIVRCSERAFVTGCRAPADANGNPFRSLEQLDAERRERRGEPEPESPAALDRPQRPAAPELVAVWETFRSGEYSTLSSAARAAGVSYPRVYHYVITRQAEEFAHIRSQRSHRARRVA